MKKFNSLICASILAVVGLVGSCGMSGVLAEPLRTPHTTNEATGASFVFFDSYTENTREHIFSGSSTTSGGTTTITSGLVNIKNLPGSKDFGMYFAPGGDGGSVTVRTFFAFGTETVIASEGTRTFSLLDSQAINVVNATSSTFSTTKNGLLAAMSIEVTAGTVTTTAGMTSLKAR